MFFSVEGGPRAGKGLLQTYLAAWAHLYGLKVFSNYPIYFPAESFAAFNPQRDRIWRDNPYGFIPQILPLDHIVDRNGNLLFHLRHCFHVRQELHQELESRTMGNQDVRFALLDWILQLGHDFSSFSGDTQDLDSIDKRYRVGVVTERVWAMAPWHEKGDDFVYGVYDRPTMYGQVVRITEADVSWLYPYYDTLHRSTRNPITHR